MIVEGNTEQTIEVKGAAEVWAVASGDCAYQRLTFRVRGALKLMLLDLADGDFERTTEIILEQEGAECTVGSVFVTTTQSTQKTTVRHLVGNCRSEQQIRGVASGMGRGLFEGLIYVAPDAQQTVALQENHNILLSDEARIETRPQLEIYADSVKCNHGATVGREDPATLFYLRQRGIPTAEARTLLLHGFCRSVLAEGNERALELLDAKLSSL